MAPGTGTASSPVPAASVCARFAPYQKLEGPGLFSGHWHEGAGGGGGGRRSVSGGGGNAPSAPPSPFGPLWPPCPPGPPSCPPFPPWQVPMSGFFPGARQGWPEGLFGWLDTHPPGVVSCAREASQVPCHLAGRSARGGRRRSPASPSEGRKGSNNNIRRTVSVSDQDQDRGRS